MQEIWVPSLCQEDALEKEMATHSSLLAWRISWTETGGIQSMGLKTDKSLSVVSSFKMEFRFCVVR